MNASCLEFRSALSRLLAGSPRGLELTVLGWDTHLLSCSACRELLAKEEALEHILASLPEPKLPPGMVERVLARLGVRSDERARRASADLDRLLELDAEVETPPDLARQVLAGLSMQREGALDRLLEEAGEVELPVGLSARVLARCAPELAHWHHPGKGRALGRMRRERSFARAAAAALLALLGGYALWMAAAGSSHSSPSMAPELAATGRSEPDLADGEVPEELLSMLDTLRYVRLPDEEEDADVEVFKQLDDATLAMLEFESSELLEGWDGFEEESQGSEAR